MPNSARRLCRTLAVYFVCSTIGCGDSSGRLAISGKVTYDGQPVTNGNIGLVPHDASAGKTVGADIVDGLYAFPRDEGPVAGSYKVLIYADRPTGRKLHADEGSSETIDQMIQYIPSIYNDRSTLAAELSADRADLDFALEKPPQQTRRRR